MDPTSIVGNGAVKFTSNIFLSNVLCLPKFLFTLLSSSKITHVYNCGVFFFLNYCVFQNLLTKIFHGVQISWTICASRISLNQLLLLSTLTALLPRASLFEIITKLTSLFLLQPLMVDLFTSLMLPMLSYIVIYVRRSM